MKCIDIQDVIKDLYMINTTEKPHSKNVSYISRQIAEIMELPENEILKTSLAAQLHDIGKVFIRPSIVNKKGKLDEKEWEEIRKHPELGYKILKSMDDYSDIADIVFQHHERWDGGGYPNGLKGEEILLPARIIAVVDAFDVITSKRIYKEAYSIDKAISEISINAGKQFDPYITEIFLEKYIPRFFSFKRVSF